MLASKRRAFVAARTLFLTFLAASEALAQFTLQDGFLATGHDRIIIRGAVYSSRPIGSADGEIAPGQGCRYARDLPLLAAAGANTVRTPALIDPDDRDFPSALQVAELYWLADFPLDGYLRGSASLVSPALRERILGDFLAYAVAWEDEPRLIGFVFGPGAAERVLPADDFFSLLDEAGRHLREAGSTKLLTTAVSDHFFIGSTERGSADSELPALDFWSLDLTGAASVNRPVHQAVGRTSKPVLVAAYGVDAFDARRGAETPDSQSLAADSLAGEVESLSQSSVPPVLGGLWAAFVDEWHLGGPDPNVHGTQGMPAATLPDGELNPAWLGMFRAARGGTAGLDTVRPRGAYFALARAWGGSVPAEVTTGRAPFVSRKLRRLGQRLRFHLSRSAHLAARRKPLVRGEAELLDRLIAAQPRTRLGLYGRPPGGHAPCQRSRSPRSRPERTGARRGARRRLSRRRGRQPG